MGTKLKSSQLFLKSCCSSKSQPNNSINILFVSRFEAREIVQQFKHSFIIHFRMAISSRKKFRFLDGSLSKPAANSPYHEDQTSNNHLIIEWIKLNKQSNQKSSIFRNMNNRRCFLNQWCFLFKLLLQLLRFIKPYHYLILPPFHFNCRFRIGHTD